MVRIGSEDWWVPKGTSLVSENIGAFNDYPVYSPEPLTVAPQETSSLYQERIYYPSSDTSGRYYSDDGGTTWNWEQFDQPPVQPAPEQYGPSFETAPITNWPGSSSFWASENGAPWQVQGGETGGLWEYAQGNPGIDEDIIDRRPYPAMDFTGVGFAPYGDPTYWEDGSWSNPFTGAPQNWIDPSQVEPGDADMGIGTPRDTVSPLENFLGTGFPSGSNDNDWNTYIEMVNRYNSIPGNVYEEAIPLIEERDRKRRGAIETISGLNEVAQEFTPQVWGDTSPYGGRDVLRREGYMDYGGQPLYAPTEETWWEKGTEELGRSFYGAGLFTDSLLPDQLLEKLPNWRYAPVEDVARSATTPVGLASLAAAPIGGVGRGLAAEALGTYGSMVAPELAQDAGIEDPRLLTASAILGGLTGGVAGFKAPEIGGGIKKAGSSFEGALESIQPTRYDELGNIISGSEFGGGRFGPLKKGDSVTGPDGTSYVVAKNTEGVPTSMVKVVDETGAEASIRRTMLDDGGTPNQSMVDYLDTEQGLRNQGIPQSEIHEGRIRQAQMFDESFARATEEGLTGRDLAIRVREDLRGQRMRQTLPTTPYV